MRRFVLFALLLLIVPGASACTGWHTQTAPEPQVVAQANGRGAIRVFRKDGSVVIIRQPTVSGDSIVGVGDTPTRRVAVATADVERIDSRGFSPTPPGGLVVGYLAIAFLVAVGAAIAALGNWN